MPETLPSVTSIFILTLLRGNSSTLVVMRAPYRPWDTYCRSRSWRMCSSVTFLNISPSASPDLAKPSSSASDLIALLPSSSSASMDGRSLTMITSTLPSRPILTSSNDSVANRLRTVSRNANSSTSSPTFTHIALNTVPAEMRCSPSTRMSVTVNACAENDTSRKSFAARTRRITPAGRIRITTAS